LYGFSLAPDIQGFDSAELTVGAYTLGFVHPPGYPLYMLLGRLFAEVPLGDVGFRLNLMSALFASLAACLLFKIMFQQTRRPWAAGLATALLATAPVYWSQAIRAEVYALHIFLVSAALLAWRRANRTGDARNYLLVFLLMGLGLGNHTTTLLLWFAVLVNALYQGRRAYKLFLVYTLLGLALAAATYLYFPWRSPASPQIDYIRPYFGVDPGSIQGLWWMISGQAFHCLLSRPAGAVPLLAEIPRLVDFLWRGLLGFGLLLAAWGWQTLQASQRSWNRLLSIYFMTNLLTFLAYHAIDKEAIFLPILVVTSIWAASGFSALSSWVSAKRPDTSPQVIEAAIGATLILIVAAGVLLDWSNVSLRGDRQASEFAGRVLAQVSPSATIVNHWATASIFDYLRLVEDQRPDVESFNVDFYFLGIQQDCRPVDSGQLVQTGWIGRLETLSRQGRLCFIEPLHDLPEGYRWRQNGVCWDLVTEGP